MKRALRAMILVAVSAGTPPGVDGQTLQTGDSVRFVLHDTSGRAGRVVSTGPDSITVREGSEQRRYSVMDLVEVQRRQRTHGAGQRAFWKGALIGGLLGGSAGLAVALNNLPPWDDPGPGGPSEAEFTLAMTTGGAMLGGLGFGIARALLAPSHEWVAVEVDRGRTDGSWAFTLRLALDQK